MAKYAVGLACEADGEVCRADSGRADMQDVGGGLEVAEGAELADEGPVDTGLGVFDLEPARGVLTAVFVRAPRKTRGSFRMRYHEP